MKINPGLLSLAQVFFKAKLVKYFSLAYSGETGQLFRGKVASLVRNTHSLDQLGDDPPFSKKRWHSSRQKPSSLPT